MKLFYFENVKEITIHILSKSDSSNKLSYITNTIRFTKTELTFIQTS